jgi:acyl-CoA thioesterase I
MRRILPRSALVVAALLAACTADQRASGRAGERPGAPADGRTSGPADERPGAPADDRTRGPAGRRTAPDASDGRPVVLILGTSLTAGLGLDPDEAYPARVQELADRAGLQWRIVNGGVSGETSAGAVRRLGWILQPYVKVLVVETGANDGLRGLDPDSTRANLETIVRRARAAAPDLRIVLAGMEAPPNLGAAYTARFRALFRDVARRERLALIPFILQGVGGVDSLNQGDGIHPNAAGARIVAANVWKVLEPELQAAAQAYQRTGVPANRERR